MADHPHAAAEATPANDAPPLRAPSVRDLEAREADLRQKIAEARSSAFVPRARYFGKAGQPDGLTAGQDYMMRVSLLEIEACRGELDDLRGELRDQREEARAAREQRILDSTRRAAWAAALAAIAAAAPTVWNVVAAVGALLRRSL